MPSSKSGSLTSRLDGGSLEWIPVGRRSSPDRGRNSPVQRSSPPPVRQRTPPARLRSPSAPKTTVSSAQFDSEEDLIKVAQSILRKRIAAAEAELPPFSTEKDKKRIRRQQRQAVLKMCNNLDVSSSSQRFSNEVSVIPNVVPRESSPHGKSLSILEA